MDSGEVCTYEQQVATFNIVDISHTLSLLPFSTSLKVTLHLTLSNALRSSANNLEFYESRAALTFVIELDVVLQISPSDRKDADPEVSLVFDPAPRGFGMRYSFMIQSVLFPRGARPA